MRTPSRVPIWSTLQQVGLAHIVPSILYFNLTNPTFFAEWCSSIDEQEQPLRKNGVRGLGFVASGNATLDLAISMIPPNILDPCNLDLSYLVKLLDNLIPARSEYRIY